METKSKEALVEEEETNLLVNTIRYLSVLTEGQRERIIRTIIAFFDIDKEVV